MSVGVWHMKSIGTFQNLLRRSFWNLPESFKTLKNQYGTNIVTKLPNEGRPCSRLLWVIAALGCWPSNPIFECIFFGNSIVYRNHRIYGGSPPLLCWLWWQSTIWKLSEMVDYHHIQVLIWWKVIIWCRSTIIFYVIARAMACRPVRVQTGECKDLIWIWWIYDGCAPYFLFSRLHELVHVYIPFGDHSMF